GAHDLQARRAQRLELVEAQVGEPMISAVVMAHPKRLHHARALAADGGARLVWDRGLGENDTGDRAWQATNLDADWAVVLQDDAIPVPWLRQTLQDGLQKAPRTCVGLYVGTS